MQNNPHSFNQGDKVRLTKKSFENILTSSACNAYPSSFYIEKIRPYVGQEAEVLIRHRPGYEITIQFSDKRAFHAKDNWVEGLSSP
jgi:hypothetical protein